MYGHVVTEALTDSGWRVFDPDYGVFFNASLNELESEPYKYIPEILRQHNYSENTIQTYIDIVKTKENNVTSSPGRKLSHRLWWVELTADSEVVVPPTKLLLYR